MRLRIPSTLAAAVLLALAAGPAHAHHGRGHGRASCAADRCAVETALDTACPCADATNHGQYVRCVARAVKDLAAAGGVGRRCRGQVVALAARSVCGRADAVVCLLPTSTCGAAGTCTNDPSLDCAADTDCGTRCTVMTSGGCGNSPGLPSGAPSCALASCFSPSGAFLDPTH